MPIYKYKHDCGFEQELYLSVDKTSVVIPCYRCTRNVTAHQVRDNSQKIKEADGMIGVLKNGQPEV